MLFKGTDSSGNVTLSSDLIPIINTQSDWAAITEADRAQKAKTISALSLSLKTQRENAIILSDYKTNAYNSSMWPPAETESTQNWFTIESPKVDRIYCKEESLAPAGEDWNGSIIYMLDTFREEAQELAELKLCIKNMTVPVEIPETTPEVVAKNLAWLAAKPWENNVTFLEWEEQ